MSGESPRSFSNIIRTALSFPSDNDSEIEFVGTDGLVVPNVATTTERPGSSFEFIDESKADSESISGSSSESTDTSIMSTTPPGRTPPSTVKINGRVITVTTTAQAVSLGNTTLYKKENRVLLSEDKRNDLFDKATKTQSTKFDLVTLTLSEEDKLDDTYSIGIQIAQLKSHFVKYDMDDVFLIVQPYQDINGETQLAQSYTDLFVGYAKLTEEKVAASNKWYCENTVEEYHRQNLQLTFDFFENNCTKGLWEKCLEDYDEYALEEKGGPLLFLIMMKKLQSHTDSAVQYLINSVKNLKISNFEGENVSRVVSLIRGANKRRRNVTILPEEFPKWVLMVLQTSSVEDFNKTFSHLKRTIEVVTPLVTRLPPSYPSIEEMLRMGEKLYLDMSSANEWTGAKTKTNQSTFVANGIVAKKFTCWNCGTEGHSIKDCPKPSNPTLQERNKKLFNEAKKKNKEDKKKNDKDKNDKTPTGKWAPPSAKENNKRTIDEIPRFWISKTKRWVKDRDATATTSAPTANVSVNATPTVASTVTTTSGTITGSGRDLALANATHSINLAVQGLMNSLRDV
jgi:Zinc knuckle